VVTAKISRPSLNPQGQASTLRAKPQPSGPSLNPQGQASTLRAKPQSSGLRPGPLRPRPSNMVIAEINICSTSDSLYVDRG